MTNRRDFCPSMRHFRVFERVAQLQGVRRASEECHVSQPAATQALANFEENLGVALLEYPRDPVRSTAARFELGEERGEALPVDAAAAPQQLSFGEADLGKGCLGRGARVARVLGEPEHRPAHNFAHGGAQSRRFGPICKETPIRALLAAALREQCSAREQPAPLGSTIGCPRAVLLVSAHIPTGA